ncbi:aspartate carbamoyltransferase catalytic subunit [Sporosarcina ureilytica]|uniref:Aspartate carbamoyltransferase n=1 Tax=Sporosarcina ureilytica TaxID=298596 RepID=A0A1D8JHY2_9BACL|nr:aspartate carbamoyltransferase catalytic subunit [Sporosarcina ureilytica]AOV08325.1 aspartate carbamoyltransferase [Sporosarcina ureilytica]
MDHLVSTTWLSEQEIIALLDRARNFHKYGARELPGKYTVSNLFFEPSTRTKISFEVAERKLGLDVVPFESGFSSTLKGETLYDTVKTFEAIGVDALVIRHSDEGYYEHLIGRTNVSIINGGDGSGQHPTQSLLDLFTIREEFGSFEGLKIVIAGDIGHSRVARSNADTLTRLGADVTYLCPEEWAGEFESTSEWTEELLHSDVIMLLRVQHERHDGKTTFTKQDYHEKYGLTLARAKMMKDDAIIMHPAPFNRGVEIDEALIECSKSRIFKQMENGVYVRMAVLEAILNGRK